MTAGAVRTLGVMPRRGGSTRARLGPATSALLALLAGCYAPEHRPGARIDADDGGGDARPVETPDARAFDASTRVECGALVCDVFCCVTRDLAVCDETCAGDPYF